MSHTTTPAAGATSEPPPSTAHPGHSPARGHQPCASACRQHPALHPHEGATAEQPV
jgi:hypothetical protein